MGMFVSNKLCGDFVVGEVDVDVFSIRHVLPHWLDVYHLKSSSMPLRTLGSSLYDLIIKVNDLLINVSLNKLNT